MFAAEPYVFVIAKVLGSNLLFIEQYSDIGALEHVFRFVHGMPCDLVFPDEY